MIARDSKGHRGQKIRANSWKQDNWEVRRHNIDSPKRQQADVGAFKSHL